MSNARTAAVATLAAAALAVAAASAVAQPRGHWNFSADNVPGWALMTPTERSEHANRMRALKTYDQCRAYLAEHRARLDARAREQGRTLREPRFDACEQMKAEGGQR